MINLLNVNSIHLEMISPLLKWRILDLNNLKEEIDYPYSKKSFDKAIRRLEKNYLVGSIKDPWSRKKFIFLAGAGVELLDGNHHYPSFSKDTIYHDAKVSEFVRELMKKKCFSSFELEHEIGATRDIGRSCGHIPDAHLRGKNSDVSFNMAFELEINRKSKSRIIGKVRRYLSNNYYDYILYLFCSESMCTAYKKIILDEFGDDVLSRAMLFYINGNFQNNICVINNDRC